MVAVTVLVILTKPFTSPIVGPATVS
jgi:hypothetical protein